MAIVPLRTGREATKARQRYGARLAKRRWVEREEREQREAADAERRRVDEEASRERERALRDTFGRQGELFPLWPVSDRPR